jgi:hypothetical protein
MIVNSYALTSPRTVGPARSQLSKDDKQLIRKKILDPKLQQTDRTRFFTSPRDWGMRTSAVSLADASPLSSSAKADDPVTTNAPGISLSPSVPDHPLSRMMTNVASVQV